MNSYPLITIGIPCFNASATLGRAIGSALAQNWPNIEVLLVDDGSTDNTHEVLARFVEKDSRIRVIFHEKNQGCASARNTIIDHAKGDFIAFFDDDDESSSNRLKLQFSCIAEYEKQSSSNSIACFISGHRVYPNGYMKDIRAVGSESRAPVGAEMIDYLLFNKRLPNIFYGAGVPACALMARTSVFYEVGKFDTTMQRQEDVDFAVRLGLHDGHFIGVSECALTQYVTNGDYKSSLVEYQSFIKLLDKNKDYLCAGNNYSYMKLWSQMRYEHFSGKDINAIFTLLKLLGKFPYRASMHFIYSASQRYVHERKMSRPKIG